MNYENNNSAGNTENKTQVFAGDAGNSAKAYAEGLNKGRKALNKNSKNKNKPNHKKPGLSNKPKLSKNGGKKAAKSVSGGVKKAASGTVKQAGSKAATNGAVVGVKVARAGATTFGSGCLSIVLPVVFIAIAVVGVIYAIFAILFAGSPKKTEQVNNEAQQIMYIFNSFCLTSDDDEKDSYYEIYKEIQANGYASALCATWKTFACDYYITNQIAPWGQTQFERNRECYSSPYDAVFYELVAKFYLEKEDGVYLQKNFDPIDFKKNNYIGAVHHYHYTNNVIKTCLKTFVNPKTGHVYEKVDKVLQKYKAAHTSELKGKKSDEIRKLCRRDQIKKAIHNLEGKNGLIRKCIVYEGDVIIDKGTDKEKTVYKKINLANYLYDENKKWVFNKRTYKLNNSVYLQIYEYDDYFLTTSNGDADDICTLALGEVGNGGSKYWNGTKAWTGGADDWCAIFLGWLMEQVGVSPSEAGWSASCSTWVGNARSKQIYHSKNSSYTPQPGDIVFFNYGGAVSTHVGLIIDLKSGTLHTVEGNTKTYDFNTSEVSENYYQLKYDSAIIGYASMSNFYSVKAASGGKISSNLVVTKTDSSYKGGKVSLSSSERTKIETLVHNELGGGGYTGCCLMAQCMRDAITSKMAKASTMKRDMGYSASDTTPNGGSVCSEAKKAVKDVFDSGKYIVKHRILYMYAPNLCTSSWHESQIFICEFGKGTDSYTRFFDRKG